MRGRPRKGRHIRPRPVPAAPAAHEPRSGAVATVQSGPRRKCVLVVEDNATVGGLLVALLREEGYRSMRAWDGREAIKMARDRRPDLIVLDLNLAYPDGLGVLRELRANEDTKSAPIVVVSGNTLELSPEERALLAETVSKPFDIDRLMNVFRRALGDPERDVPEREYEAHDTHLHSW
jgi:DNA-binding response OmpR family regulator